MTIESKHHGVLPPPSVVEVSDGVFGYIQLDGSWGLNNTGFVVGREEVVAIDACFTERRTRALLDALRAQAGGRRVRTLVNTHHHGDHTFGNFLFAGEATIVGHELCGEAMVREGLAAQRLFQGVEWGEITVTPPAVTFTDRLQLWLDGLEIKLIHVGPAHTTNDVVAWIPERRVLFSGDVLFHGGAPFALAGSVAGWLAALDRLRGLGARTIVPGHGAVCGPDVIDDVGAYLRFVQDAARRGFDAGLAPLELASELDLGRFAGLLDGERLLPNLHRAYSELRGEPLGTPLEPEALADMIAYNGGRPPRCVA